MPLPSPKGTQSQQSFINSCMGNSVMNKEYPNQKQRTAVCYSQWKRAKSRKKSKGSTEEPKWDDNDLGIVTFIP